jgi:putative oxidoreductase
VVEKEKGRRKYRDVLFSPYLSLVSRLVLGGVFLYAGASKVFDPGACGLYTLLRARSARVVCHPLGLRAAPFEVLLGLYLLMGHFTRASAWTTNGMMILFIVALAQGALRGLEIDCGCFGSASGAEASSLWVDLVRDLGLLALGLQIAFAPPGKFSLDARQRRNKA